MTRASLNTTLRRLYILLGVLLVLSLVAKFKAYVPGLAMLGIDGPLGDLYEYLRDMSLLIATGGVAYLTNVFQKRSGFTESLEEEWRGIVRTKATLYTFCEKPFPSTEDYLAAFSAISCTIDNMRIVYRNVGETDRLIGLYPYAPLHDMRRALQTVRDAVLQAFYALRETFLEELDLEEPSRSMLATASRRAKQDGATLRALRLQEQQSRKLEADAASRTQVDELLWGLRDAERAAGQKR